MAKIAVDNLSLKELMALEKAVAAAIEEKRVSEKAEAKAALAALAAERGFSLDELIGGGRGKAKGKGSVPAKYRNPDNPAETWTGRGRQPLWLAAQVKKGVKLEKFLIK